MKVIKSNTTLKKIFNYRKHNTLRKTAKQIKSKTLLPVVLLPIIACSNPIPTNVNNEYFKQLKHLKELLANGDITQKEYNERIKDLKDWHKIALNTANEKLASSQYINKTSPEHSNGRRYTDNYPNNDITNFEGKNYTTISNNTEQIDSLHSIDEPEPSNLITRAVSWVKKKLHISNKPKTEISQENIAIVPGTTEFDIAKDKEFIAIAYSDDIDIPDTLEGFVDLSSGLIDPSELSDTVLDSIVDDLDLYSGISGAIKIFIEDIFDL